MARRGLRPINVFGLLLVALLLPIEQVRGLATSVRREDAIRDALLAISTGKVPPNDDQLIDLIDEDLRNVLAENLAEPAVAIDAVARAAQEAVSEVTAAYTAAIFRSSTQEDAERLFGRFQDTIERIVGIAKHDAGATRSTSPRPSRSNDAKKT